MITFSRKINEEAKIGDDITVRVIDIRGNKVRLGFEAPNEIPILQGEVYLAIKRGDVEKKETKSGNLEKNVDDSSQKQGGKFRGRLFRNN